MTGADPLAALILLCGFGLLACRRLAPQITLLRLQSGALAAAAAWAAYVRSAPQLVLAALIIVALQALLLPAALQKIAAQTDPPPPPAATLPIALLLILLAMLVAPLALAVPLAVFLLGLLATVLRRDPLAQTIGLFAAEAGLMLAAITSPGLPLIAPLAVAALILPAAVLAGVARLRPRGGLATLAAELDA